LANNGFLGFSDRQLIGIILAVSVIILTIVFFPINSLVSKVSNSNINDINIDVNKPQGTISQGSVIDAESVFVNSDQDGITQFLDKYAPDGYTPTPKFAIQSSIIILNPDGKTLKVSNVTESELVKQLSLYTNTGEIIDLDSFQSGFTGIGTKNYANLEVKATVKFCLDTKCDEKKLYAKGTTIKNQLKLYFVDNFQPQSLFSKKFDYTFTIADEGENWTNGSTHYYRIILSDITFTDLVTNEVWSFFGDEIVYELAMTVDDQKSVVFDKDLNQAVSIFKKDNVFTSCASSGATGVGFGNSSPPPTTTPIIKITVNGIYYDTIPSLIGITTPFSQEFLNQHIVSGQYVSPAICKKVNLPRNSEITINIVGTDYKFFTPKSQANFSLECHNNMIGTVFETRYGDTRPIEFRPEYHCSSNVGYSK